MDGKVRRTFELYAYNWSNAWTGSNLWEDYIYRDATLMAAYYNSGQQRHMDVDHLGTPRLLTNVAGNQTGYHVYLPYGVEATASDLERLKFTGHERDLADPSSTADDLDYMHARHASPITGRFLSVDEVKGKPELPQSWNRYEYAYGNPIKFIDPTGRDGLTFTDVLEAAGNAIVQTADQIAFGVAYPGLKIEVGILKDDPKQLAEGAALIAADAAVGLAMSYAAEALQFGWTSSRNLIAHFEKHGGELGFRTAREYAGAASRLVASEGKEASPQHGVGRGRRGESSMPPELRKSIAIRASAEWKP